MKVKEFLKYLDPYTYMDMFIAYLHKKGINIKILDFTIYIIFSLILAYLLLYFLGLLLGTKEAMMIVVSGSMEPTLQIGDIVVLTAPNNIKTKTIYLDEEITGKKLNDFAQINYDLKNIIINGNLKTILDTKSITINNKTYTFDKNGTIIVYYSPLLKRKIIHRAIFKIIAKDGNYYITKGDNEITNTIIDEDCKEGCIMPYPIPEKEVLAKYLFKIPYLGYIKILPFKLLGLN